MLRKLVIILLTFTALNGSGGDFIVTHKSCKILGQIIDRTGRSDLYEVLEKELNLKNFEITYVTQKHTFKKGDLILSLESEVLKGGLFPPCFVEIVIKEEGSEKKFFSAGTKRALPRHLSSDNYLCKLAVRDVLYHLPYCKISP
jgi:hypothetical protein